MATTTGEEKWTAAEVLAACKATRWQLKDWLHWSEITMPGSSRRIDLLALARWRSRGWMRVGVEIKVTRSDLLQELKNPGKSDATWRYVDEFWIAAPAGLIGPDLLAEIPDGWGVIEFKRQANGGWRSKTVVKPGKAGCEQWPTELWVRMALRDDDQMEALVTERVQNARMAMRKDYEKQLAARSIPMGVASKLRRIEEIEAELGFELTDWNGLRDVPMHRIGPLLKRLHTLESIEKDLASMELAVINNLARWRKAVDALNQGEDHDDHTDG